MGKRPFIISQEVEKVFKANFSEGYQFKFSWFSKQQHISSQCCLNTAQSLLFRLYILLPVKANQCLPFDFVRYVQEQAFYGPDHNLAN
ncbi:MAG TPA: hypothetical protein DCF33_16675 [Saprospirales bacterium]|nr:hypothetical protein [Saprospirales bacterium]